MKASAEGGENLCVSLAIASLFGCFFSWILVVVGAFVDKWLWCAAGAVCCFMSWTSFRVFVGDLEEILGGKP